MHGQELVCWERANGSNNGIVVTTVRTDKTTFLGDVSLVRRKGKSRRAGDECVFRNFTTPLKYVLRLRAEQHGQGYLLALLLICGDTRTNNFVALRTAHMPRV